MTTTHHESFVGMCTLGQCTLHYLNGSDHNRSQASLFLAPGVWLRVALLFPVAVYTSIHI